ncbi:hypothetical protein [Nocardioides sp.]|uniref:hypothetical protein n=1 Tax=Nocardioides sp. TaxID=35761 RepID=UPI002CCB35F7|nr:hypothetical protein [Nocardioides sp.]HXH81106.1 hypothetical protein [Nocardioides sp.]
MSESEAEIGSVEELLESTRIIDVLFMELNASRIESSHEESAEAERDLDLATMLRHEGNELDVRFLLEFKDNAASYRVDVVARYCVEDDRSIPPRVSSEFIERVAAFAAFPFLREALATSAARLRVDPPILGILRQGDIKVSEWPSEDAPATS